MCRNRDWYESGTLRIQKSPESLAGQDFRAISFLFPLDFPTHQKSSFILYDLICFCHRIFRPDHAIVASVGVPASTAADQRSMKLTHSPIVGIAESGSTCIKPCFFANSAFGHCVKWYLRSMVLFVVRLGDVAEACRMLCVQLSVLFPPPRGKPCRSATCQSSGSGQRYFPILQIPT